MWNWISVLDKCRRESRVIALITVIETSGSTPRDTGAKMVVFSDGTSRGTIGGGRVEYFAVQDALRCLQRSKSEVFSYPLTPVFGQCCGGSVRVFVELLNLNPHLYIFGAGHVGHALCQTLEGTAFVTHIIDARAEWVEHSELPESVRRHATDWKNFAALANWSKSRTYAAIMTPEHSDDLEIVRDLLRRPLRFLGLIGSRAKWKQFCNVLTQEGFQSAELDRVRCPIGIGNTGKSPREIAVSIAAEILINYHETRADSPNSSSRRKIQPTREPEGPSESP